MHTPGPWTIRPREFDPSHPFEIESPSGQMMATNGVRYVVAGEKPCRINQTTSDETVIANARLISAAPEMAQLLVETRKRLMDGQPTTPLICLINEVLLKALAE